MDFRYWKPGDETAIVELFETVFSRPMSLEFWKWRFLDHPSGNPLVALAWDGDRLAGHYAASQAPLTVDGEIVPAALSMTTMTHPDYRGRKLLENTAEYLYEELNSHGFCGVWGFPNQNVNGLRQRKLNWVNIGDVPSLTCRGGPEVTDFQDVKEVDRIDQRFTDLASRTMTQTRLCFARSKEVLEWRIDRSPRNVYRRYLLPDGASIRAYLIAKTYQNTDLDIVEIKADDAEAADTILRAVIARSRACGIKRHNVWCLHADPFRVLFERLGFAATAPITYFGGRTFRDMGVDFGDSRAWRLSFLDSDLY